MVRKAELADGSILEFPDETPDSVIENTVRKLLGGVGTPGISKPLLPMGKEKVVPPVPSLGFAGRVPEMAGAAAGATGGAIVGSAGGPLGSVAGAFVGGGIGAGLGALGRMEMERIAGTGKGPQNIQDFLSELGEAGVLGAYGGAAGELPGALLGAGVSKGIRGLVRGGPQKGAAMREMLGKFQIAGAEPTVGMAATRNILDSFEASLARLPGGAGVFRKKIQEINRNIGDMMKRTAQTVTGRGIPEPEIAGAAVGKGITEGFIPRFKAAGGQLSDATQNLIGASTPVEVSNTRTILKDVLEKMPSLPDVEPGLLPGGTRTVARGFLKNTEIKTQLQNIGLLDQYGNPITRPVQIGKDKIPYQELRTMRSLIGEKLSDFQLVSDIPRGDLKRMYGALSEDLKAAARASGPDAEAAFAAESAFWKKGFDRIDDYLEKVAKKIPEPEKLFDMLWTRAEGGPTLLNELRQSLTPEEWAQFSGTIVSQLGEATPGQATTKTPFSFNTWLTNWNRLDDTAKDVLFRNVHGAPTLREDLQAVAESVGAIRENLTAFANPYQTASGMGGLVMAGGVAAGAVVGSEDSKKVFRGLLILAGGVWAFSHMLTSPRVVHWLAEGTKINPTGLGAHFGRLTAIAAAEENPTVREALLEFTDNLRSVFEPKAAEGAEEIPARTVNIPLGLDLLGGPVIPESERQLTGQEPDFQEVIRRMRLAPMRPEPQMIPAP